MNPRKSYTEPQKYSGKDDHLDQKLLVFHDLCDTVNLPEEAKPKAFCYGSQRRLPSENQIQARDMG